MRRNFKKCLITGISGSGGSFLAEHINKKKQNIKIYGLYRKKGHLEKVKIKLKQNLYLLKCDLTNFKDLKKKIKNVKPDVIFHLASDADVRKSFDEPYELIKNNNTITLNLLEVLRQLNFKPIIVICSTSEVYGSVNKSELPITEKTKINPINPYAASKAFQDMISQVYYRCYGLPIIITRMFTYNNPRRSNLFQSAFASQIVKIERGKQKYLNHGNLNSLRTSLDINDAMEAYWLAANRGKLGEIYNISGNKIISVKNYLKKLISLSKEKIILKEDRKLHRKTDIKFQVPSTKKFKIHTKWKEYETFDKSIENFLNYFRSRI